VREARRVLDDGEWVKDMVENNYLIARRHFSYSILQHHFKALITELFGA